MDTPPAATIPLARVASEPPRAVRTDRLMSLDAFRGFTMFWLLGGKAFVVAVATLAGLDFVLYQLGHSAWEGVRYYDLVWPSFMLMVGMAVPFSFARRSLVQTRSQLMLTAWKRAIILFLLGSVRESLSSGTPVWFEMSSALQPIAIAYLVTSYLAGRPVRLQIGVAAAILAGYAALLAFVPAGEFPAGTYEKNRNVITAVDLAVLGRAHPAGWGTLLSMIPTIATTIVGLLLGQVLMTDASGRTKAKVIGLTGLGCLAAGYAVSPVIPIIMKLWTTSYALVVTGWACLLFLVFYWLVDLKGWQRWSFPLIVIGVNALAAYLLPTFVPMGKIVGTFTKPVAPLFGDFAPIFTTGAVLLAGWLLLLWLYRRKIFLRP